MKELQEPIATWKQLKQMGRTAALATLVKVEGSAYLRPGARMLITSDGQQVGTISGGCLESDVVERSHFQDINKIIVVVDNIVISSIQRYIGQLFYKIDGRKKANAVYPLDEFRLGNGAYKRLGNHRRQPLLLF